MDTNREIIEKLLTEKRENFGISTYGSGVPVIQLFYTSRDYRDWKRKDL